MGIVYVVHCIDTEGPLYQEFDVPFKMVEDLFGVKIDPTEENLVKLQNRQLDIDHADEIARVVAPHRIMFKGNWSEINETLLEITSVEYRNVLLDSNGQGWKYSWFCMDHVGFYGQNPRRRDAGHHKVFDRYFNMVSEQKMGDIVQFHHHPVSYYGNFNDSGTAFWGSGVLNDILCHKIIDRKWFPSAFRPGFHTERPDSHWFLEQWIPFDYGNQSYESLSGQNDMSYGRFGNWEGAPLYWRPYHPSHDDYRKEGDCHRWITRCLNMCMRARQIEKHHIVSAFEEAQKNGKAILAFTGHDYKDIKYEITRVRELLQEVDNSFSDVNFIYTDAVSAYQKYLGCSAISPGLTLKVINDATGKRIVVKSENGIFGAQPFLAIKSISGTYFWDNFDFVSDNTWTYVFDHNTIFLDDVMELGVAANSISGVSEVISWKNV